MLFGKVLKQVIYVKIYHEAKLQAFVKNTDDPQLTKTFHNRRVFRELHVLFLRTLCAFSILV